MLEQSDAKVTKLKEELVNTKEALNKASLEHEVLSHEKAELGIQQRLRYWPSNKFVICTV